MASAFLGRAAALCLAVVLLSGCEALLFFPQQQLLRTPEDVGLVYQDVRIPVGNTALHGWWLPAEQPRARCYSATVMPRISVPTWRVCIGCRKRASMFC